MVKIHSGQDHQPEWILVEMILVELILGEVDLARVDLGRRLAAAPPGSAWANPRCLHVRPRPASEFVGGNLENFKKNSQNSEIYQGETGWNVEFLLPPARCARCGHQPGGCRRCGRSDDPFLGGTIEGKHYCHTFSEQHPSCFALQLRERPTAEPDTGN